MEEPGCTGGNRSSPRPLVRARCRAAARRRRCGAAPPPRSGARRRGPRRAPATAWRRRGSAPGRAGSPVRRASSVDHPGLVARVGVEPRPHRGAAQPQRRQLGERVAAPAPQRPRRAALQPETSWPSRMGVASMRWVRPAFTTPSQASALRGEGGRQALQRLRRRRRQLQRGEAHGGGHHVVGGLRHVDVVVGVHQGAVAAAAPQQLAGAVGQHLVHVHVVRGAGAGLVHVHHELFAPAAVEHLLGRARDGLRLAARQEPQLAVHPRRGELDAHRRVHEGGVRAQPADGKVLQRPRRLRAVERRRGHGHLPHGVALHARGGGAAGGTAGRRAAALLRRPAGRHG